MANAQTVYLKEQRTRRTVKAYQSLMDTPANLGNVGVAGTSAALALPANARLGVSFSASVAAGDLRLDVGPNKSLNIPALAANRVYRPGVVGERGQALTVVRSGAPTGTATVYIIDGSGRARAIATATFTV